MSNVAELTDLLAKATAQLETQSATAKTAADTIATLSGQVTEMTAQLNGFKEAIAAAEQEKAEAALASRKAALAEVLPADQVEAKLSAYATLDNATFDFILGELKATKEARAAGFKAVGVDGDEETETVEDEESKPTDAHAAVLAAGIAAAKAYRR